MMKNPHLWDTTCLFGRNPDIVAHDGESSAGAIASIPRACIAVIRDAVLVLMKAGVHCLVEGEGTPTKKVNCEREE